MEPGIVLGILTGVRWGEWGSGGCKGPVVALIGLHPEGVMESLDSLADQLGMSRTPLRKTLSQLVADAVVLVQPAAGSRAAVYYLNPLVTEWRHVPWRVPAELVAWRAAASSSARVRSDNGGRRGVSRTSPRLGVADNAEFAGSAQVPHRAHKVLLSALSTPEQYDNPAGPQARRLAPGVTRADKSGVVGSATPVKSRLSGGPPTDVLTQVVDEDGLVSRKLRGVVRRATGATWLKGYPLKVLAELVVEHGEDAVAAMALRTGTELYRGNPSGLVDWVADMLASEGLEPAELVTPDGGPPPSVPPGCDNADCIQGWIYGDGEPSWHGCREPESVAL